MLFVFQLMNNQKRFSEWLTIGEYSCLSYLLSFVAYSIAMLFLDITKSGFLLYENHDEVAMLLHVVLRFIFAVAVSSKKYCSHKLL